MQVRRGERWEAVWVAFRRSTLLAVLATLTLLGIHEGPRAWAGEAPAIESIQIGIEGVAKLGHWTPLRIALSGGERDHRCFLEIETVDGEGLPVIYEDASGDASFTLKAGQPLTVTRYYKPGRTDARIRLLLRDEGTKAILAEESFAADHLPSTVSFYLQLGRDLDVGRIEAYGPRDPARRVVARHVAHLELLPDDALGYDAVNAILVTTSADDALGKLSDNQRRALMEWVRRGGRIVLTVAEEAERLFAPSSPWAAWSPGSLAGVRDSFETTGLMRYAKAAQPLPPRIRASFLQIKSPRGQIVAFEGGGGLGDWPMLVRHAFGFGQVLVLLVDLDGKSLVDWLGAPRLMAKLLGLLDEGRGARAEDVQLASTAYSDISGQLRDALDLFSNVVLVHFSWIAGLVALYAMVIGPLEFAFWRWLRRPHGTWWTLPLWVVAFAGIAVVLSRGFKGKESRVNQVEIYDIDGASGAVRATVWAHLYSPDLRARDVILSTESLGDGVAVDEGTLTWHAVPGTRIGGMRGPTGMVVQSDAYRVAVRGVEGRLEGLPATVGSTKSLRARWQGKVTEDVADAARLTATRDGLLSGYFSNPLPVRLERVAIAYGGWLYRLPYDLEPQQRVDMRELAPLDLKWQLTRRRVVRRQDASLPWDPDDIEDLPRIVEMLMFYDAAGGLRYTRLRHEYQHFVDLSGHLHLQRAMLIGRVADPKATVEFSKKGEAPQLDRRLAVVRILWPVQPESEAKRD